MISRGEEVAPEVLRLLPDLSSGALSLPYERYGTDALGEAVERLRTGAAVGKIVLDLGDAGNRPLVAGRSVPVLGGHPLPDAGAVDAGIVAGDVDP